MKPIEFLEAKKQHLARLANERGAAGEVLAIDGMANWVPRPRGKGLKILLAALRAEGISIKPSSFDAISLPSSGVLDFENPEAISELLPSMVFVEVKTANQTRVREDFSGFFFALTESEISAAEALGSRHRVALYNKNSGAMLLTSVPEILAKAKSTNWQVSVQL
ncbi:MAG TPA: hypothetical protein VGE50_10625 [Gammaproteobacteria bacterium]